MVGDIFFCLLDLNNEFSNLFSRWLCFYCRVLGIVCFIDPNVVLYIFRIENVEGGNVFCKFCAIFDLVLMSDVYF